MGGKPQQIQVRGEYQELPWPGGSVPPRRDWNQGAGFFVEGAGAKASSLRQRSLRVFFESLPIPTDASGAYRPNPQANNKAGCPPSLNGYNLMTP
jgi:hypothetical protein